MYAASHASCKRGLVPLCVQATWPASGPKLGQAGVRLTKSDWGRRLAAQVGVCIFRLLAFRMKRIQMLLGREGFQQSSAYVAADYTLTFIDLVLML